VVGKVTKNPNSKQLSIVSPCTGEVMQGSNCGIYF
jgi:hypothetical protein